MARIVAFVISAHSDEIGGVVRHIDERGFLRFDPMGGVSPVLLVARRVSVGGYPGVVGTRPGHLLTDQERRQAPGIEEMYIDLGFDSADEVRELGIDVGTPITYISQLEPLANPERLNGKSIDNRLGCAILLQLFRSLSGKTLPASLTGVVCQDLPLIQNVPPSRLAPKTEELRIWVSMNQGKPNEHEML